MDKAQRGKRNATALRLLKNDRLSTVFQELFARNALTSTVPFELYCVNHQKV